MVHTLAAAGVVVAFALDAGSSRWSIVPLAVIMTLCGVSTFTEVETGSSNLKVSGGFLGIVLAVVLLGGAPGAIVGLFTELLASLRIRPAGHYVRNNLLTFAWSPLIAGIFFDRAMHLTDATVGTPVYYLLAFAAFLVALAVNFLSVAGYQCYLDRSSLKTKVQDALVPLLSAELFSCLLTVAAVAISLSVGTMGLVLFGVVLIVFQHLIGELLKSKHRAEELHRRATRDDLTGLLNREQFRAELQERIERAGGENRAFAVMLLDLDRFKEVNDTLGHQYGDSLLRQLGSRLAERLDSATCVARLGGDEFAILPATFNIGDGQLEATAASIIATVQEPISMEEITLEVGASIGIARFPVDGRDADTLMRRADISMYAAKDTDVGWRMFTKDLDRHSARRLTILSDFRRALDAGEIVVHYQPIIDAMDSRVRSAEGLVRWQHPDLGLIPPGEFVGVVERSRLIGSLTRHVVEQAVAHCASWRRTCPDLTVSCNLSVRNLMDRGLPGAVARVLSSYGLPPEALQLEITESMLMSEADRALSTVLALTQLGIRISVDDFGTGYSSLANLRRLPIDEVKIDRSFVSPMLSDDSDLIIVRSTINLGHDLGLRVIAEGVEDEKTLQRLATLGCDLVQGFHISRPLPPEAFADWMHDTQQPWLVGAAA